MGANRPVLWLLDVLFWLTDRVRAKRADGANAKLCNRRGLEQIPLAVDELLLRQALRC